MLDDAMTVKTAFVRSGHWLGNPTEQLTAALQVPLGGCVRLPLLKSRHPTMQMDSSRTNAKGRFMGRPAMSAPVHAVS